MVGIVLRPVLGATQSALALTVSTLAGISAIARFERPARHVACGTTQPREAAICLHSAPSTQLPALSTQHPVARTQYPASSRLH